MRLLITLCFISFTFASAQNEKIKIYIKTTPVVITDVSTHPVANKVLLPFLYDNRSKLAKKKSYKNIIENTLSGQKHLIFKVKHEIKYC